MVAFIAATGVVTWAVLHFSTSSVTLPPQQQKQLEAPAPETPLPPPAKTAASEQDKADKVFYTPVVAAETSLPAGHGVIDVSAPAGAVVLVDGKEHARGSTKVQAAPGNHDVRVRHDSAGERAYTINVRTSRVAHVRFE